MQSYKFKIFCLLLTVIFFFTSSVAPVFAAMTYTYDANGNMTSDGTKCYHYNEANQMDKVTNCANGQTIAEYIYDYSGTRLVKKEFENGVLKKTVYSPADEYETVKQATSGATQNTTYYKANDETVAKKNPDGSITYYSNDHLGSSAVLSDQTGAVVEKTSYEPYGEVKSGGTKSKFGYTGQEKDNETGLNYYGARYYDPHLQRFVQPDTWLPDIFDPQQLNRYSYANNNPLKYTDPTGHFLWLIPAAVIVARVFAPVVQKVVNSPTIIAATTKLVTTASNLAQRAGNLISSAGSKVADSVKSLASSAGNTIKSFASGGSTGSTGGTQVSSTLRGAQNPGTQQGLQEGRQAHTAFSQAMKAQNPNIVTDKAVFKEFGSLKRPDAIDFENKLIHELKPRWSDKAEAQLQEYIDLANNYFGPGWEPVRHTYK